jgi:hypothetical protein
VSDDAQEPLSIDWRPRSGAQAAAPAAAHGVGRGVVTEYRARYTVTPIDCKHGQLARSCPLCEKDDEIDRLQFQLARTEEALLAAQSDARSAWSSCRAADKDIERLRGQKVALLTASQAVIDRWHTPSWKDVPATAGYIMLLEHAVAEVHGV